MPVVGDTRVLPESLDGQLAQAARGVRGSSEADEQPSRPGIFKAYDVRGIYPDADRRGRRLPGRARAFARVLATLAESRTAPKRALRVAVGHDMRLHSPALADAFARGLTDEGCDVLDIGDGRHRDGLLRRRLAGAGRRRLGDRLAQPEAVGRLQARARGRDRRSRATAASTDVRRVVAAGRLLRRRRPRAPSSAPTSTRSSSATSLGFIDPEAIRPMKVVLDGGNGMAGPMIGPDASTRSRSTGSGSTSSPTASSPATSRTRCWRRTAS